MLSILLALVACGAPDLDVRNNEPEATLIYPLDGEALAADVVTTLRGTVYDTNDDASELLAAWYVNGEETCPPAPVSAEGTSNCEAVLLAGDADITLVAIDPLGAEGDASVATRVAANQPPMATVLAPADASVVSAGEYLVVEARVGDLESAPEALSVEWTDDKGETVGLDTHPDADGTLSGAVLLAPGVHTLTVTVKDPGGALASAQLTVDVVEE
jgi:hypothetical protein